MNILVAYCLLVAAVAYAFVTSKYVIGAALVFGVIVVETVVNIPRDTIGCPVLKPETSHPPSAPSCSDL